MTIHTRYNDVLRIKEHRESNAESKLMQARRLLTEAVAEEKSAHGQLQDVTTKCQLREQELYQKLLSGNAVKVADIDQVKFEIEGLHSGVKRVQEDVKSAQRKREQAEQARDQARMVYQKAMQSREKSSIVFRAQRAEQERLESKRAEDEVDEFSDQRYAKRGLESTDGPHEGHE
jgi:flagellar biosynthesis chaperone FliJ